MQKKALAGRYGAEQGDRRAVLQVETHDKLALVGLQVRSGRVKEPAFTLTDRKKAFAYLP